MVCFFAVAPLLMPSTLLCVHAVALSAIHVWSHRQIRLVRLVRFALANLWQDRVPTFRSLKPALTDIRHLLQHHFFPLRRNLSVLAVRSSPLSSRIPFRLCHWIPRRGSAFWQWQTPVALSPSRCFPIARSVLSRREGDGATARQPSA